METSKMNAQGPLGYWGIWLQVPPKMCFLKTTKRVPMILAMRKCRDVTCAEALQKATGSDGKQQALLELPEMVV